MSQPERIRVVRNQVDPEDFDKLEKRVETLTARVEKLRIWQAYVLGGTATASFMVGFGIAVIGLLAGFFRG